MTAALGGGYGIVADPVADAARSKYVSRERLLGYLEVLHEHGIEPLVHKQRLSDEDDAYDAALRLLDQTDRPTAVLCFSDVVALGVVRAAEELGLEVPRDLSVVGFDDSPLARRMRPALTTVRQDVAAKGRMAAAALTQAMAQRGEAAAVHQMLPTELVVRQSTAPPRV